MYYMTLSEISPKLPFSSVTLELNMIFVSSSTKDALCRKLRATAPQYCTAVYICVNYQLKAVSDNCNESKPIK